jgi:putative ABC transport system substrate-binding protein
MLAAFHLGLKETGFVEGENVSVDYRWADGHFDRLPALAADLVRQRVTLLAATSTPACLAAKAATATIPIIFTTSGNPVQLGLVANLGRPGGNVTGATQLNVEVGPKRLELLHQLMPSATVMGLLINPAAPTAQAQSRDLRAAARALGLQLHVLSAGADSDLETVFTTLRQQRASGLVIGSADPFFTSRMKELAVLALRHAVPTIYQYPEFTAAGGLMSYGGRITDTYHVAGLYAGRVLKGEKPGELPVQQTTKFEFFINLRTAKALGLQIPLTLLTYADEVIE